MSGPVEDPELEAMLRELTSTPEERDALLEEHRQLEKDLLRLADPPPPADFVALVMKKVAAAPALAPAKREIFLASLITVGAFVTGLVLFLGHGATVDGVGLSFASVLVHLREAAIGLGSACAAVWRTSALPVAVALAAMLGTSIVALKRLGTDGKVTT